MNQTIKRILASLLIASLLAIIVATVYFGAIGSRYFPAMLFLMMFYPVFLWAMAMVYKWGKDKDKRAEEEQRESDK